MTTMTSNDLLSLGMPAIAGAAVLMTGGVVAYWATRQRRLKSKPRKVILADSDLTAKASVAGAEVDRIAQAVKDIRHALKDIHAAAEDAERLLTIDRHATEKT
jgi:hypothetical protein